MTQIGAIALSVAACALIVSLALGSNALLDRYLPAQTGGRNVAEAPPGSPCVDDTGKWINWPWPNVPTLAPRCPAEK